MKAKPTIILIIVFLMMGEIAYSQIKEFIGDTIQLNLQGYTAGNIQWQFSKDKNSWTDLTGERSESLNTIVKNTGLYRAKIQTGTCDNFSDSTLVFATLNSRTDTIPNVIYIYFKDSITFSKVLPSYIPGKYVCNNTAFGIKNDKLFLNVPNDLKVTEFNIILTNQNTGTTYPLRIKARTWIKDKYTLYPVIKNETPQFICTVKDTVFSINNGKLYFSIKNQENKTYCAELPLSDMAYNQFISKFGYFAFRTGGKIYVSSNLKDWDLIYVGKIGIKESMVLVHNKNGYELIFSEYSPGTNFTRHHIKSYNLTSKELTNRMIFYTTQEFQEQGLTPYARHIHFLLQDTYSGMIFLSTGDTSLESSIYYSKDHGLTFSKLGDGSQYWRSLTMFFTDEYVFWNMDTATPQYLIKLKKSKIHDNLGFKELSLVPLINSANWCSESIILPDEKTRMIVMSSNNEGAFYDNNFRNYGIVIENNEPIVYELLEKKALGLYSQYYPIGTDFQNNILFLDMETNQSCFYKVIATH